MIYFSQHAFCRYIKDVPSKFGNAVPDHVITNFQARHSDLTRNPLTKCQQNVIPHLIRDPHKD